MCQKSFLIKIEGLTPCTGRQNWESKNHLGKASLRIFDFKIKELWLESGKKISTQVDPILKIFFSSFECVKINQKILRRWKSWLILNHITYEKGTLLNMANYYFRIF